MYRVVPSVTISMVRSPSRNPSGGPSPGGDWSAMSRNRTPMSMVIADTSPSTSPVMSAPPMSMLSPSAETVIAMSIDIR